MMLKLKGSVHTKHQNIFSQIPLVAFDNADGFGSS